MSLALKKPSTLYEQLWTWQAPVVDEAVELETPALFADAGSGKTWMASAFIERIVSPGFRGLVVAPLNTLKSSNGWLKTLSKVPGLRVVDRLEDITLERTPQVLVIHWQKLVAMQYGRGKRKLNLLSTLPWGCVVADESQNAKSRSSKTSKSLGNLSNARYKIILSGTPFDHMLDKPDELWAQLRFLKPELFGTNWKNFDSAYLYPTGWMGKKRKFTKRGLDRFLEKAAPWIIQVNEGDHFEIANKTIRCGVDLLGEQRRIYDDLEAKQVVKLFKDKKTKIKAKLKIVENGKLQQITGGMVKDEEGEIHPVGKAKQRKLRHLLKKRMRQPVLIFCRYVHELHAIERIASEFYADVRLMYGKTRKQNPDIQQAFQRGEIDCLVAQIRSGGVGIDLFEAADVIFYSLTWSFIDYRQALKRILRPGQKRLVKIWLLFAKNTVDEPIYEAVISKRSANEFVMRRFKSLRRPEMAKKTAGKKKASTKKAKAEKKEAAPKKEAPKYGITELAEALGVAPASARVKLRKAGIEKNGGRYGWDTKSEMQDVIDSLDTKGDDDDED